MEKEDGKRKDYLERENLSRKIDVGSEGVEDRRAPLTREVHQKIILSE